MSSEIWNPGSSASVARPADDSEDSSAEQPASLCLLARLPPEIWRQLIGLLSYSDVAACSCSTGHENIKPLLMEYMRQGCCISTFKRLLVEYAALRHDPDYGEQWDPDFWKDAEERKHFWTRAIEMIFLYDPKLLKKSQRCDALIQQDYIHSCGVLFASDIEWANQRELQRQFRAGYGAPNHVEQPWFPDYYYPRAILESEVYHFLYLFPVSFPFSFGYGTLW